MVMLHVKGKVAFLPVCSSTEQLQDVWSNYTGCYQISSGYQSMSAKYKNFSFAFFPVNSKNAGKMKIFVLEVLE